MKSRFVRTMLILSMLLVMAVPTQAFAAEKNCSSSQPNVSNTNYSKIYSQFSQTTFNRLMESVTQFSKSRIDYSQLRSIFMQYNDQSSKVTPTVPSVPATPAKPTVPATPAVPTKPTVPATPAVPANPTTPTSPAPSNSIGSYEQQVVDLVNKERAAAGLSALKVNTKLAGVAEKKAEDLRDNNYFSHTSPTYGSPFDMMKQFGISYSSAGENIAKGQKTPASVMDGWMNSQGHRENILNSSYTEIGVGYVTDSNGNTYWVQMFIRP